MVCQNNNAGHTTFQTRRLFHQPRKKLVVGLLSFLIVCTFVYLVINPGSLIIPIHVTVGNTSEKTTKCNRNRGDRSRTNFTRISSNNRVAEKTTHVNNDKYVNFILSRDLIVPSESKKRELLKNMTYLVEGENILKMKPIKFLSNFQNPCWYEDIGEFSSYTNNCYNHRPIIKPRFAKSAERIRIMKREGVKQRLRCLPYFYLIGQPKCGTTNLYYRLSSHPDITPMPSKEPHWWTRHRIGGYLNSPNPVPLRHYVDLLDIPAVKIEKVAVFIPERTVNFHPVVTGDGSASTMWDNDFWWMFPENRNLTEPRYLTPHYIKHLQPDAKFIVILRNPTERMFSDYMYFSVHSAKTSHDFHMRVEQALTVYRKCAAKFSIRACAYSRLVRNLSEIRLRIGLYVVYLRDWFNVFSHKQIHVVRLEDYASNTAYELARIFYFLNLRYVEADDLQRITSLPVLNSRKNRQQILPKTRVLLDSFFAPYNNALADLLGDAGFKWEASNATSTR